MKQALIICLWIFNIILCGHTLYKRNHPEPYQVVQDDCTKDYLSMESQIDPYFDEFIEDCKARSIKYDHVYCLSMIEFCTSDEDNGYTNYYSKKIQINRILTNDSIGLRFVLYHEMGHWLGLRHSDGIMAESYGPNDRAYVADHWDTLTEDYFNKLKHLKQHGN